MHFTNYSRAPLPSNTLYHIAQHTKKMIEKNYHRDYYTTPTPLDLFNLLRACPRDTPLIHNTHP